MTALGVVSMGMTALGVVSMGMTALGVVSMGRTPLGVVPYGQVRGFSGTPDLPVAFTVEERREAPRRPEEEPLWKQ
jgi:hypothetical protein